MLSQLPACFDSSSYASLVRNYCYLGTQRAAGLIKEKAVIKLQACLLSVVRGCIICVRGAFAPGGNHHFRPWGQPNPTPSVRFWAIVYVVLVVLVSYY